MAGIRHKIYNNLRQFLALILLQEVTRPGDDGMRLAFRAWHKLLKNAICSSRDSVRVAKCCEEGLFPAHQYLPGLAVCLRGKIIRRSRYQQRKLTCPSLVAVIWKWRVVGRNHFRGKFGDTTSLDNASNVELWRCLRVLLPGKKCLSWALVSRRQPCICGNNACKTRFVFSRETQTNQSAPVLAYQ